MRTVTLALLVLVVLPAWASEPGQPLDCRDWVFNEPGYTCIEWRGYSCGDSQAQPYCAQLDGFEGAEFDNQGRVLFLTREQIPLPPNECLFEGYGRWKLMYDDGTMVGVIAYLDEQCDYNTQDYVQNDTYISEPLKFDDKTGTLLVKLLLRNARRSPASPNYSSGMSVVAINGFPTTFEVMQSYEPQNVIGLRVPYMPEGFQHADYFDTFWGDLATVGDWSQAQPLQCGYPATAPSVGDYLTVDDTLPTPASGQGYYYVTAVNYQGQRRYGRQSNGGVLTGRDPVVLPGCSR